jgi:hypothetical protein
VDGRDALAWTGKIVHGVDKVLALMAGVGLPRGLLTTHVGKIPEASPEAEMPCAIALLRIDTDWYASHAFLLATMYRRVAPGGVVILDDYGGWMGARKATDEWLAQPEQRGVIKMDWVDAACTVFCKPLANGTAKPCDLWSRAGRAAVAELGDLREEHGSMK